MGKAMGGPDEKAKYSYLENIGCYLFFIIGGICSASVAIMNKAFDSSNAFAGALAVSALAAMGVGVAFILVRVKS
jgi:hypothetical protein